MRVAVSTAVKSSRRKLTHVIPSQGRGNVTAVAAVGDELYVLRFYMSKVEVYDAVSVTLKRHLTVPGPVQSSYGLAVCPFNNCLYASGTDSNTVYRVHLTGRKAPKRWPVARTPVGLSVNNAHNLVVACFDSNKLQEYTKRGFLVREIDLGAEEVESPWHAVQLSSGAYVVSQARSSGVVSVIGVDRRVICNYGQSSDFGEMNVPESLAATTNDDFVVADKENGRIVLIRRSTGCTEKLALPVEGGMRRPMALCLDESRGRLYVGEFSGEHRVLVFDNVIL